MQALRSRHLGRPPVKAMAGAALDHAIEQLVFEQQRNLLRLCAATLQTSGMPTDFRARTLAIQAQVRAELAVDCDAWFTAQAFQ